MPHLPHAEFVAYGIATEPLLPHTTNLGFAFGQFTIPFFFERQLALAAALACRARDGVKRLRIFVTDLSGRPFPFDFLQTSCTLFFVLSHS